jgi:DNA-binding CsgD family transcriptional regulator
VLPTFLGGDVRPGPARLTARELEIANLAVMGRPSKDIAAVLGVSVRTVNNLLQRTYTKLGITSRADLPSALSDHLR